MHILQSISFLSILLLSISSSRITASPLDSAQDDVAAGVKKPKARAASNYPGPEHRRGQATGKQNACSNPSIRKEWRELSPSERKEFVDAVVCLRSTPSILSNDPNRSVYDDFAQTHVDNTPNIHNNAEFLPWHRTYLVFFEVALKDFCGFTGTIPYWNWSLDSQAPENSPIWRADALGGDGDPAKGLCIPDGPFANIKTAVGKYGCVQRNFDKSTHMNSVFYTPEQIRGISSVGSYNALRYAVGVPHAVVHNAIGGDMSNVGYSPNDPVFVLHHAFIDKLWTDWQEKNPAAGDVVSGNRDSNTPGANDAKETDLLHQVNPSGSRKLFVDGLTIRSAFWSTGGGYFCYRYSAGPTVSRVTTQAEPLDAKLLQAVIAGRTLGTSVLNITASLSGAFQTSGSIDKIVRSSPTASQSAHILSRLHPSTSALLEKAGALAAPSCEVTDADTVLDDMTGRTSFCSRNGTVDRANAPDSSNRMDLFALRQVKPLPEAWLKQHNFDITSIRLVEARLAKVVDIANSIPGYVSRAALARRFKMGEVVTGNEVEGVKGGLGVVKTREWETRSWDGMSDSEKVDVEKAEEAIAAKALGPYGL
ncbi:hypothetical protein HDU97_008411 [Phlyctochytrium planicorne]|nr:hypothetical protein HDU97_008411 [Phlyctochytrium planicorne]